MTAYAHAWRVDGTTWGVRAEVVLNDAWLAGIEACIRGQPADTVDCVLLENGTVLPRAVTADYLSTDAKATVRDWLLRSGFDKPAGWYTGHERRLRIVEAVDPKLDAAIRALAAVRESGKTPSDRNVNLMSIKLRNEVSRGSIATYRKAGKLHF